MTAPWLEYANKTSGAAKVSNISLYFKNIGDTAVSPIDRYYENRTKAILTAKPELLNEAPWLSGFMLVSLVSATELFFREIFTKTLVFCPVARKASSEKSIHMGAILWHGQKGFSKAAFEHSSLADSAKIKACSKDYLNFEIKKSSSTFRALEEFDKLCELRHGVVHSWGVLPGKNAIKLMVPQNVLDTVIEFDAARLHEAASICTSLVESYNSELFEQLIERWAVAWRAQPDWSQDNELTLLRKICSSFCSESNPPAERISILKLRNSIKKTFNI